jgi:hypothetical protein
MPGTGGINAAEQGTRLPDSPKVLVLTPSTMTTTYSARSKQARADFLHKNTPRIRGVSPHDPAGGRFASL